MTFSIVEEELKAEASALLLRRSDEAGPSSGSANQSRSDVRPMH